MFNFARKPHQPIFDSWLLSSHAVRLFMLSVRFHEIAARGARSQLTSDDEYTLRVWNGLCLVHYQYAVLTDRPVTIPGEYLMMCELLTSSASFDNCSLAEIKLYQAVMAAKAAGDIVPLRRWYRQFGTTLLSSSPDLRLGYDLCVIILEAPAQKIEASIRVLNLVLSLPCDRIAAMPNYPLIIIIHAVMTLCKHLSTTTDVGEHLTLIVRIYWYLAQIGEQSRDIVDSIARIIKSVIMATRKGNEIFNHVVSPNQQDLPEPKLLPPLQDSDLTLDSIDKLFFDTFDHSQCKSLDEFCNRVFNYVINKTDLIWTKD